MAWASSPRALCWGLPPCFMEACEVFRGPEPWGFCFGFFFFLGKKVDQVFCLSLLWTLSLSARRVCCIRPWRMAQATSSPAAVCFIISLSPSRLPLHLIRERWAWMLWRSWWEAHWLLGRWKSPLFWSSPSGVTATSPQRDWETWHVCMESVCSLTFGWELWSLFTGLSFMALSLYWVAFVPPGLRFVWFCAGSLKSVF